MQNEDETIPPTTFAASGGENDLAADVVPAGSRPIAETLGDCTLKGLMNST